ncbi:MAG: hypothetical protein SchgKO_21900 [Schleiferiaceae bacterium]
MNQNNHKKTLSFALLFSSQILLVSCSGVGGDGLSQEDRVFEKCQNEQYNPVELYEDIVGIVDQGTLEKVKSTDVHKKFEDFLIQEKYLSAPTKKGYAELLQSIGEYPLKPEVLNKFHEDLGFIPILWFPPNSYLACYEELLSQKPNFDLDHWAYQFAQAFNAFEAYGKKEIDSGYLIAALDKIPEDKFDKIMYREIFLNLVYNDILNLGW